MRTRQVKTMDDLMACFDAAKEQGALYIAIVVHNNFNPVAEVIINPKENFNSKQQYYKTAYNRNLSLKNNNTIKIACCVFADTFEQLEMSLKGLLL